MSASTARIINLSRGIGVAIFSLTFPSILARTGEHFNLTSIAYQLATQAAMFESGLVNGMSYFAITEPGARATLWKTGMSIVIALQVLIFASLNIAAWGLVAQFSATERTAFFVIFNGFLFGMVALVRANFAIGLAQANREFLGMLFLSWVPRFGFLMGLLILFFAPPKNIALYALPGVLMYITTHFVVRRRRPPDLHLFGVERPLFRKLLIYIFGAVGWNIAGFLISWSALRGMAETEPGSAGVFALTFTGVGLLSSIMVSLTAPTIPDFTAAFADRDEGRQRELHRMMARLNVALTTTAALAIMFAGLPALNIWLGSKNIPASFTPVFFGIALYGLAKVATIPFATIIVASGRQGAVWLGPFAEALTAVLLCQRLKSYGGVGCVHALYVAMVVGLLPNVVQACRIPVSWSRDIAVFLASHALGWLALGQILMIYCK
jgi:O-antigen/teichoic acid export membrane protein